MDTHAVGFTDLFFIKNGMSIKEVNFHHVEVCEKAFIADKIFAQPGRNRKQDPLGLEKKQWEEEQKRPSK